MSGVVLFVVTTYCSDLARETLVVGKLTFEARTYGYTGVVYGTSN